MKQVGLTGGIGSGKTYVSRVFAKLGIPVFNSDIQAKKLMSSNSILINSLKQKFGDDIYNKNKINRERIRNIIFKDQNALKLINDIVHPFVNQNFNDWTNNQDADYVVKEAAILFETGGYKLLDCNILVYSPINLNIERVMLRDKLDKDKVIEIINSQASFDEVKKKADYVIYNDQEDFILPQIIKIHNQILNK
ncbi:MAG: dephospho-CoA kinase [Flavobacteriales bacterium]|nr:dephospho-CoA kinase [Flavobacteriales bacterium]